MTGVLDVRVGDVTIGPGHPLVLIAGPCVIEDDDTMAEVAGSLAHLAEPVIFKSSYDKANRSKHGSFRGPGFHTGMVTLKKIREDWHMPVTTDVHSVGEAYTAAWHVDMVQIPAALSRQTDILVAAGNAGKPVNVKRMPNMRPETMGLVVDKCRALYPGAQVLLTDRGTGFGYGDLIMDVRNFNKLGLVAPVCADVTHSAMLMGGTKRPADIVEDIEAHACAAVACGVDAIFMEVHPEPEKALCDSQCQYPLYRLEKLVERLLRIREAL